MAVELPMCRWRRQPVGTENHVCVSPRIRCNAAGIPDAFCFSCRWVDHEDNPPPRRPCVHFGELVKVAPVKLLNRTDGASILSRYHRCAVHGLCTPNTANCELPCCMTCPNHRSDWQRDQAGEVRHLTYFLHPAGPWWVWNVDQLVRRMALFNGRRLVAVAVDANTAPFDQAAAAFAGHDCELLRFANDPGRKEMVAHMPLIERLASYRGDGDVTFYGHAKGSGSHAYGEGVKRWAEEMYRGCLDYWPAVRRELRDHMAVGVFRRVMSPAPAAHVPWHYSGSFRWLRNKDLYARDWRHIDETFYGPETYPGLHVAMHESACLYGEFAYGGVGLYLQATWDEWAAAAADDWRDRHAADRQVPGLVTCILCSHDQPELVHQAIASVREQTTDAWQLIIYDSGPLMMAGAFERYRSDARVVLHWPGPWRVNAPPLSQPEKINEVRGSGLVRGDLVVHLADDDVYAQGCFAGWIEHAAANSGEVAWYGTADRGRLHRGGFFELLGPLGHRGDGDQAHSLRGHVDAIQVCVRSSVRTPWPEAQDLRVECDGYWMEAICREHPIRPAPVHVGTHRHTPRSTFTR